MGASHLRTALSNVHTSMHGFLCDSDLCLHWRLRLQAPGLRFICIHMFNLRNLPIRIHMFNLRKFNFTFFKLRPHW